MLQKLKDRKQEGFTIIEVLIVLAIAGLIMLIVFLAVPALQRNSRNNGRNNDASRIVSAVEECLANRNGAVASCDTAAEISAGTLSQLTTAPAFSNTTTKPTSSATQAGVWFKHKCLDDGSGPDTATAGDRQFVVLFTLEGGTSITRCLAG